VFRVKRLRESKRIALVIGILAAFLAFTWHGVAVRVDLLFMACLFLLLAASEIVSEWRGTAVELRVTNLVFFSRGHAPGGYTPSIIARADIYDLQYREAQRGGGEFPDLPEGLYVEYSRALPGTAAGCVLPNVGKEQTEQIIESILSRFPDTGKLRSRPAEQSRLISLDLSGRADL
jgi:hypothetical protein